MSDPDIWGQLCETNESNSAERKDNMSSTQPVSAPDESGVDRELKAKHRALWAAGDYPAVAAELISEFGPELVRACGVQAGDRVLDVAAGSGNAAIPAAEAGATVTASDLTPELFEAGPPDRRRARCRAGMGRGRRGGAAVRR